MRRPGAASEKEEKRAQTSRRPFSNGRGGPQRGEEEEEEDVYDDPEGDVRGEEVEIVLPTAPRRKPKPIVCHTGASTELYANPRNCRSKLKDLLWQDRRLNMTNNALMHLDKQR